MKSIKQRRSGLVCWLVAFGLLGSLAPGSGLAQSGDASGSAAQASPQAEQTASPGSGPTEESLEDRVRVGLYVNPPFVIRDGETYSGMAYELWDAVSADLGVESDYVVLPTVRDLVAATAAGDVDVAVANLTVTKRRAEQIDFTYPWYDAGLRIMIDDNSGGGLWALIEGLYDAGFIQFYAWIIFVILIGTVVLTVFDRRFDKDFPKRWREGIAESFYTVMSVATTGRMSRKNLFGWRGRIWSALWLVCGVAVLAFVTSSITSVMTTIALTSQINNADDLPGRTVGVRAGGTAEDYAIETGLTFEVFDDIDQAAEALVNGDVDAIIGDGPVLEYFAHSNHEDHLRVVGPVFRPEKYAFGVSPTSPLARPVTLELIGAFEIDQVEALRAEYFGDRPG